MANPVVAVVGRPNVGKSTLFNRLVGKRIAIVEDTPGITRDRIYAVGEWIGRDFVLIDTGGIVLDDKDPLTVQVRLQAEVAMEEADVIVLIVDVTEGVTASDLEVADVLRRTSKPVILVANKVENPRHEREALEFYSLGLGDVFPISAVQGYGVAELLDKVVENLPEPDGEEPYPEDTIRIAIVGRPNVGKSSMLNAFVEEERQIVSDIPGTTRDAVDTYFQHEGQGLVLIDTAGIRRAGKIQRTVEYYSVLRATRAIERADVALLIIDASEGIRDGDKRVGGLAHEAGKASVIVVNKWDLRPAGASMRNTARKIRDETPFLSYAPIVFTSAIKRTGIGETLDSAILAAHNHALRLPTGEINRIIQDAVDGHPLTQHGKQFKVYYATMPAVKPPTIVLFTNDPNMLHFSYQRYLENQVRKHMSYEGTPIRIHARKAESTERRGM